MAFPIKLLNHSLKFYFFYTQRLSRELVIKSFRSIRKNFKNAF